MLPPAALLPASMLGPQLASRVGGEQLARVEPMLRDCAREDRVKLAAKLRDVRAAVVPEGAAVRHVREREDLLYAAVAVRGDNEDVAWQGGRRRLGQAKDDVVMELALRPVGHEVITPEAALHLVEQGAEDQATRKVGDGIVHATMLPLCHSRTSRSPARTQRPCHRGICCQCGRNGGVALETVDKKALSERWTQWSSG
jgi:hypothetical protein